MAKKKVQPTPEKKEIFKVDLTEDIETGTANGIRDAEKFYQSVITDFRLNKQQKMKKLNDKLIDAKKRNQKYHDKVEKEFLLKYTMDFCYWRSHLSTLHQNGVNGEVVKNDAPQQGETLKDIFKEGRYNDFISIIEALNISSNGRIKRKRNLVAKALAVYEYAKKQDMIIDVKHTIFCKLFSLHYNGSSMIDSTISKAYNEKKRNDFLIVEKLLKDRK